MDKFVVDLDRILDDLEAQECESMPSPQLKYVPCTGEPLADGGHTRPGHSDHEIGTVRHQESDGFSNGCCSSPDTMSHSPNAEPSGTLMSCKSPARVADPAHHCETPIPFTSCLTSVCSPSSSAHPKSITNGAGDLIPVKSERETVVPAEKTHLRMSPGSSDTAESTSDSPTQVVAISSIAAHVISPVDRGTVSDDVHDGAQSFQGTAANGSDNIEDDEEILAKVMKDVEEYEKSRGPDGNAGPHEYEDEELNRIIRSIDDWGKLSGKIALDQADEDFEDENEYDEDLAKLTNGLLSHTSSLKPGKEISHKAFAPESRDAALADSTSSSLHINSSEDHAEPSQCLRFADCRVDSDDLSEEQMNAYLRDVRSSPQAPPSPVSGPSEDHGTPSQPIDGQTRAVRPNSLDLDLMNEPLMLDTTEVLHTAVPDESLPRDGPPSDPMHEEGIRVGHHRPFWIPDEEAPACMHCDIRFTVIKRRHHCRACGKVLCAACCNMRAKLPYMDFRETRVCSVCYRLVGDLEDADRPFFDGEAAAASHPSPCNPREYCSTIPPDHQVASDGSAQSLPTVFVPVGVLKRADRPRGEPKQVVFSDGIRPGCDLRTESGSDATDGAASSTASSSRRPMLHRLRSPPVELNSPLHHRHRSKVHRTVVEDASGPLPAILNCAAALSAEPTMKNLLKQLRDTPLTFYLTKNLHVQLKLVLLDCCAKIEVWSFMSKGLCTVGQDEIAVILERVDDEMRIPRDVFRLITSIYDSSSKGLVHSEMSHILFPEGLFGSKEYCGFLFVRPTAQCLSNVILPPSPFLVALLIQRIEVPWAKVFPLRLILRLGAEFNSYPCPVVSYRQRKAVYCEVGHTILNVLADFRNFHWTIPVVQGVVITRDCVKKKTTLHLPRNRYDALLKILNQNNEHVLALGGNLNLSAESHYACYQNEEGQYHTYILSATGSAVPSAKADMETGPKSVGASFMVFSGALKTSSGMTAKMSIVEDGILIQILPNVIPELKKALRDMKDFEIQIGKVGEEASDCVAVEWGPDDLNFNVGVRSAIDGRSLAGVPSVRIHNSTDFANKHFLIRWTEVFFVENQDPGRRDAIDPTKVARVIAQSLCRALTAHLDQLVAEGLQRIGLRVSLDPEQVGYEVGSNGQPLPALFVNELDEALIPVITGNFLSGIDALMVLELFFCIIVK